MWWGWGSGQPGDVAGWWPIHHTEYITKSMALWILQQCKVFGVWQVEKETFMTTITTCMKFMKRPILEGRTSIVEKHANNHDSETSVTIHLSFLSRRRGRTSKSGRSTWIVPELISWTRHPRPGISMVVVETTPGYQVFKYVHSQTYQQCQFRFLDAVESLNPENIMVSGSIFMVQFCTLNVYILVTEWY